MTATTTALVSVGLKSRKQIFQTVNAIEGTDYKFSGGAREAIRLLRY
jgi:hypothetical protein